MPPTMIESFAAGACVAVAAAFPAAVGAALGVTAVPPQAAATIPAMVASAQMRFRMYASTFSTRI